MGRRGTRKGRYGYTAIGLDDTAIQGHTRPLGYTAIKLDGTAIQGHSATRPFG